MQMQIDAVMLSGELAQKGYQSRIIPCGHIRDLQVEI